MAEVNPERVTHAYQAIATGDRMRIAEFYDEKVRWLVPGEHALAGWYDGLDAFLDMMGRAHKLTGGTFAMVSLHVMTGGDCSADVCRNTGMRLGAAEGARSTFDRLDVLVTHFLRWRDGKIVEGRDGLFGADATAFGQFWSPLSANGNRYLDPEQ